MKKTALLAGIISFILGTSVFSEESRVGYKEFNLGQTRQVVNNLVRGKYVNITFSKNQDMKIETGELVFTELFFDHDNNLFYILVEVKAGEISKLKQRLVEKYGQPNDNAGEEFNRENKSYLTASWLIDKRYKIALWESDYCRSSKLNPCIIYVEYIDLKLKENKEKHEQKSKLEDMRRKDSKTYDGF